MKLAVLQRFISAAVLCVQVNVTTIDGVTPLFHACSAGSLACLELLLQSDARPQALAIYQPSPIHEAVSRGGYTLTLIRANFGTMVH